MTKLTIEYMAGFFDGEGCVELSPKKIQDRISVVNTNKTILEYIQETFGGSIISKKISGLSKKVGHGEGNFIIFVFDWFSLVFKIFIYKQW